MNNLDCEGIKRMSVRLEKYSFRFSEEIFNSRLTLKNEIESIIYEACKDLSILNRKVFNEKLCQLFTKHDWDSQIRVSPNMNAYSKFDFAKDRVAVEVQFGHASFIGIDLLKFQMASYSNLDLIDYGVYITTTKKMQKHLTSSYKHNWEGSLNFEKVVKYLPHFKSAIQVPIYVIGIDI
ncbi:MAG: restriction endonuclease [Syntrophomonadaceae bacterium]|nr:restriction endonuclease [Syntrophomonadaceae bacterium]